MPASLPRASMRVLLGMTFGIGSAVLRSIALLVQKHSARVEDGRKLWRRPRLFLSILLNITAEVGLSSLALLFAPLNMLAPLGGVSVLANALLTRFGLVCGIQEKPSSSEWAATLLVLLGVSLVAICGGSADASDDLTMADLPDAFSRPGFLLFAVPALIAVVIWSCLISCPAFKQIRPDETSLRASLVSGVAAACSGAFAVMFVKVVVVGISEAAQGGAEVMRQPQFAFVWASIILVIGLAILQLYLLNCSLKAGEATFAVPLYTSALMILMSFFGGIAFDEFVALARRTVFLGLYVVGVLAVVGGLFCLSVAQRRRNRRIVCGGSGLGTAASVVAA